MVGAKREEPPMPPINALKELFNTEDARNSFYRIWVETTEAVAGLKAELEKEAYEKQDPSHYDKIFKQEGKSYTRDSNLEIDIGVISMLVKQFEKNSQDPRIMHKIIEEIPQALQNVMSSLQYLLENDQDAKRIANYQNARVYFENISTKIP